MIRLRSTRGVSLLEVLIVIAIIGLLVSLAVPAIQVARESARRLGCASNLRQLGIALSSYHSAHRYYPPSLIWAPAGEPLGDDVLPPGVIDRLVRTDQAMADSDRAYGNWLFMLLPYLEESELYSQVDFTVPIGDVRHADVRATEIRTLRCASDMYNREDNHYQRIPLGGVPDAGYSRANYAMNMGTNDWCLMGDFDNPYRPSDSCNDGFWVYGDDLKRNVRAVWGSGIGGVNRSFSSRDFPSGLSRMVALDEIRAGVNSADPRGVWALGFVGSSITAGHGVFGTASGPNHAGLEPDNIANCAAARLLAGGPESLAALGMGCNPTIDDGASFLAGARSLHPGGVNLLMLDGSVHFIQDEVDAKVWHNMHRRDNRDHFDWPL